MMNFLYACKRSESDNSGLPVGTESRIGEGVVLDLFLNYLLENENDSCIIWGIKIS